MLAGIGVIIILKQLPHAFGYDADFEGDQAFIQSDGQNSFTSLLDVFNHLQFGAVVVTIVSLIILISWEKIPFLKNLLPQLHKNPWTFLLAIAALLIDIFK